MAGKIHDEQLKVDIIINGNEAQKELGNLQEAKRNLRKENEELRKEKAKLVAEGKKESDQYKRLTKQISENNTSLRESEKKQAALRKELGLTGLTTRQLASEQKRLKSIMGGFTPESPQWKAYNEELKKVNARVAEIREEMKGVKEVMNDDFSAAGNALTNIFNGIKTGDFSNLVEGLSSVKSGLQATAKAALTFIATPLGATFAALAAVLGAGKMWFDYNVGLSKTLKLTEQLTDLQGADLSNYRAQLQGVAKTFDQDYNEVLRASNALAKQMKISQTEALKYIEQGFLRGADAQGKFLDHLKEYPVQFKQAGYSAQEFIDIATQEAKGGVYNDKLLDTVKEINLSLRELDKAQVDVLEKNFGKKFSKALIKGINKGEISSKKAFESIVKESKKMGLSVTKQQKVVADIFKAAGEDAGGFSEVIFQLNEAFKQENKQLSENEKAMQRLTEANKAQEEALADLFDASKSGFPVMLTNLKALSKEIFTNTLRGFRIVFTSIEQLKQESALKGQSKAVKEISENMKLYGTTAKKQVENQISAALKNIDIIKKKLGDVNWVKGFFGGKKRYEKSLAEAQAYYDELLKIKEGKSAEFKKYQETYTEENYLEKGSKNTLTDDEKKILEEKRKAQKKLLEAQLKAQEKFREQVLFSGLSLLNQEQQQYQDRLKQAGIFSKAKESLTKEEIKIKELLEAEHQSKIAKIELDSVNDFISNKKQQFEKEQQARQTDFNNELLQITSIAEAKKVLTNSLSQEQLERITTFEQAKEALKREHQSKELTKHSEYLKSLVSLYKEALGTGLIEGVDFADTILTEDQKEALNTKLDEVKTKLSEVALAKKGLTGNTEEEEGLEAMEGVDIFGSSPDQWQSVFDNLDTTKEKVGALETVLGGLQQAWGMYNQFVANGEKKQLKKLEKHTNSRKQTLKRQLDDGVINQETYNKKVEELDNNLAKKKAQIDYKQAKREQTMALFSVAANTAAGIMGAVNFSPETVGMPWTAIIGAMGALQAGLILSADLPKPGFENGLYKVKREDGKKFNAKLGTTKTQLVNEPTLMDGKYLTGERSTSRNPEMIIDDVTFSKLDPNIPKYIMDVHNGVVSGSYPGYEKGKYKPPIEEDQEETPIEKLSDNGRVISLLTRIAESTEKGNLVVFGYEEAIKISRLQEEITNSKKNGTVG